MRRNGGPVFPAHANPGDPNGPLRGLAANETACALISMMARSTLLQAEAGYIDARPQRRQIEKFSCDARPDHTSGQKRERRSRRRPASRAAGAPQKPDPVWRGKDTSSVGPGCVKTRMSATTVAGDSRRGIDGG